MDRKRILVMAVSLCIFFLIFLFISVPHESPDFPLESPSEPPVSEGPEIQAFSLNSFPDFFHQNVESFERLKDEVSKNDIPFQLTMWRGETSISSAEKDDICESDIVSFDKIISDMRTLSIIRVHYYKINPTKMILYFESDTDSATLNVSYGSREDEIGGQLFGRITLYDQWVVYARIAE